MSQIYVILATQRSGTVALSQALEGVFGVSPVGEVFNSDHANSEVEIDFESDLTRPMVRLSQVNYFNFRFSIIKRNPELAFPSIENQQFLYNEFIEYIQNRFDSQNIVIDIKYSSWHHFDSYWSMPSQRPGLAGLIIDSGFPIIHIVRENLFSQYCSLKFAMATGVWHLDKGKKQSEVQLDINPKDCEKHMQAVSDARIFYHSIFSEENEYMICEYSNLFRKNRLSGRLIEDFSRVFNEAPINIEFEMGIRKTTPPLYDIISNTNEVIEYFSDTRFESIVRKALNA